MKEILTVHVTLNETQRVEGNHAGVCMISFSGHAEGPCFQGSILPHGVDTQRGAAGETPVLSARYMMEGTDAQGNPCRLFIENNGRVEQDGTIRTRPSVITDSPALAWLEDAQLSGTVEGTKDGVLIHIFAPEDASPKRR